MKRYINNKVYDTETAKHIGTEFLVSLYRKKTGEYFKYIHPRHSEGEGEIVPLTYDEAREWAEKNLDSDVYDEEFGAIEDSGERETIHISVRAQTADKLRRMSREQGRAVSSIVEDLIK